MSFRFSSNCRIAIGSRDDRYDRRGRRTIDSRIILIVALFCFQWIVRFDYCTEITEPVRMRKRASSTRRTMPTDLLDAEAARKRTTCAQNAGMVTPW